MPYGSRQSCTGTEHSWRHSTRLVGRTPAGEPARVGILGMRIPNPTHAGTAHAHTGRPSVKRELSSGARSPSPVLSQRGNGIACRNATPEGLQEFDSVLSPPSRRQEADSLSRNAHQQRQGSRKWLVSSPVQARHQRCAERKLALSERRHAASHEPELDEVG